LPALSEPLYLLLNPEIYSDNLIVMQLKKIPVIIFLLLLNMTLNAQYKKGMRMAGASVGSAFFNSGKSDFSYPPPTTGYTSNTNNFGVTLNPSMGWFVSDNTAIGALLNFGYNHQKTFNEVSGTTYKRDISNSFNIGIGGFARNYFKSSGTMMPFGQFNLNFGIGSTSNKGFYFINNDKSNYDGKSSGDFFVNTGIALGLTKMLNEHTGFDFFVGYTYSYNKRTFKTTTITDLGNNGSVDQTAVSEPTQKFTNHGISIGVGFQVFLDKRK
jgi:hypothetical protein